MPHPILPRWHCCALALAALCASSAALAQVTVTFRNGDLPTAAYAGTTDTCVDYFGGGTYWDPNGNYSAYSRLNLDGSPTKTATLIKWELAAGAIPASATVSSASLVFWVTNAGQTYNIYESRRAWTSAANWTRWDGTNAWGTAGAQNTTTDIYGTVLGTTLSGTVPYQMTIPMNASGIATLQAWVSGTRANYGFIIGTYANTDGIDMDSSEGGTPSQRPMLVVNYAYLGVPGYSASFQQGVLPTSAYAGTTDTVIASGPAPTCDTQGLGMDADSKVSTLLKFDVSAVPAWGTVQSASFTFNVTDPSSQTFNYGQVLQAWDEAAASWTNRTSTSAWAGAGITGAADHGAWIGTISVGSTGIASVPISASGVQLINNWASGAAANYGFLFQNYATNGDGLYFDDSENATVGNRPALTVTYTEGGKLVFTSSAQTAPTGATSSAITVQRQSSSGIAATASTALTVNISSNSSLGQFSGSSTGPWSSTLGVTIPAGQSTASFYYRDGATWISTLTATGEASWTGATQTFTTRADVFADDFETNALLPPTGRWTSINAPVAANSIATDLSAWHRGTYGALFNDADTGASNYEQDEVDYLHAPIAPAYYARTWMQIFSTNRSGTVEFFLLGANNGNTLYQAAFGYSTSLSISGGGYDSTGTWRSDTPGSAAYTAGAWHLVEMAITGLGTASGTRKLYVDGTLATSLTGVNLGATGFGAATLAIGEPWSDNPSFTGKLYFDDVRVSTAPLASKLALAVPGAPVNLNACVAITASLRDSLTGALAAAPYGVVAGLSVTGVAGAFYSNSGCTTAATTVSFAAGASQVTAYFKPAAAGTATLSISHPDFLSPAPAPTLTVVTGSPLAISPTSTTVSAGATVQFTASGGSGVGYSFSILTNNSGATWANQATGLYKAGSTSGVTDTVRVTDSLGATASATVTVLNLLAISPTSVSVGAGGPQTFTASGGVAPYTFSMAANPSGGSVTAGGAYTAGNKVGVTDQVRVTDAASSTATATVSVTPSSTLRVQITGPSSFAAGAGGSYALAVVDGAGNRYWATKAIQANLRPVASGPAISAAFNASSIGATGGATTSGNTDATGAATVGVQDVKAESFQLCATVDATEQCTVVTANPGPPARAQAQIQGSGTVPACSSPTLSLALVDAYGNVVPAAAAFTLCTSGGGGTITSTTLQSAVPSGSCVSGQLPAGGATATVTSLGGGTTTFTPSSPSAPGLPIAAQLTWAAPALSLQGSILELANAQSPADLPTGGGHLTARVAPRDSCGNAVSLPSSQVFLEAPEPLAVGPAASDPQDSSAYLYDLSLSACPADPTSLLLVPARLSGEPLVDSGGAFRALAIRPICRPARFASQGNTAAQCRLPYRYSDTGIPDVSGDGPFTFRIAGNSGATIPDGLTLSPAGEIFWLPTPQQAGLHSLSLTVAGAAGQDTQRLDIQVTCPNGPSFRFCSCSAGEGLAAAGIWLLCAAALRLRRRRG